MAAPQLVKVSSLTRAEVNAALSAQGILTASEKLRRDRLLASEWYLVRNDGGDRRERVKCRRPACAPKHTDLAPRVHEFFTWCCEPRPFNGLTAAMYALAEVRTEDARLRAWALELENLARSHPFSYGRQLPQAPGEHILAFLVGALEPITATEAARYTFRVQYHDRRFDPAKD